MCYFEKKQGAAAVDTLKALDPRLYSRTIEKQMRKAGGMIILDNCSFNGKSKKLPLMLLYKKLSDANADFKEIKSSYGAQKTIFFEIVEIKKSHGDEYLYLSCISHRDDDIWDVKSIFSAIPSRFIAERYWSPDELQKMELERIEEAQRKYAQKQQATPEALKKYMKTHFFSTFNQEYLRGLPSVKTPEEILASRQKIESLYDLVFVTQETIENAFRTHMSYMEEAVLKEISENKDYLYECLTAHVAALLDGYLSEINTKGKKLLKSKSSESLAANYQELLEIHKKATAITLVYTDANISKRKAALDTLEGNILARCKQKLEESGIEISVASSPSPTPFDLSPHISEFTESISRRISAIKTIDDVAALMEAIPREINQIYTTQYDQIIAVTGRSPREIKTTIETHVKDLCNEKIPREVSHIVDEGIDELKTKLKNDPDELEIDALLEEGMRLINLTRVKYENVTKDQAQLENYIKWLKIQKSLYVVQQKSEELLEQVSASEGVEDLTKLKSNYSKLKEEHTKLYSVASALHEDIKATLQKIDNDLAAKLSSTF